MILLLIYAASLASLVYIVRMLQLGIIVVNVLLVLVLKPVMMLWEKYKSRKDASSPDHLLSASGPVPLRSASS